MVDVIVDIIVDVIVDIMVDVIIKLIPFIHQISPDSDTISVGPIAIPWL